MAFSATRVLFVFVGLFGFVAAFSAVDSLRRETLEVVSEPTSLGDEHFFPNESDFALWDPVLTLNAKPLYRANSGLPEKRDWLMVPDQFDDSGEWLLYLETLPRGSSRELDPELRYLKVGKDQYLRLTKKAPPEA
tara:strand:+ start:5363 stop:5767 length:405 start_codon:yes stop_codon:yes gene_type:complete